jgi:hypothetical protein
VRVMRFAVNIMFQCSEKKEHAENNISDINVHKCRILEEHLASSEATGYIGFRLPCNVASEVSPQSHFRKKKTWRSENSVGHLVILITKGVDRFS